MGNQAETGGGCLIFFVRNRGDDRMIGAKRADFTGTAGRSKFHEEFSVDLRIILPLRGNIILVVNRLNWTNGLTCTAVHALIGLYVEHTSTLIDAIHRALFDAGFVLHIDTRLCNYVSQGKPPCGQCRDSNPHSA